MFDEKRKATVVVIVAGIDQKDSRAKILLVGEFPKAIWDRPSRDVAFDIILELFGVNWPAEGLRQEELIETDDEVIVPYSCMVPTVMPTRGTWIPVDEAAKHLDEQGLALLKRLRF